MLSIETKYVCDSLIGIHANFCNNRTIGTENLNVKIRRWGGGGVKKEKVE